MRAVAVKLYVLLVYGKTVESVEDAPWLATHTTDIVRDLHAEIL